MLPVALIVLAGCAAEPNPRGHADELQPVPRPPESTGQRAAIVALDQLGAPYRYGGSTPGGFDCSGLIHYAYEQVGKQVPRTTGELWDSVEAIDRYNLRAGDLLFFRIDGKMSHVGLYVGEGRFVHAPSSGKVVSVDALNSEYYTRAFLGAGRLR